MTDLVNIPWKPEERVIGVTTNQALHDIKEATDLPCSRIKGLEFIEVMRVMDASARLANDLILGLLK